MGVYSVVSHLDSIMSQQQFYETVQRQEEQENDMKLKTFAQEIKEELMSSQTQYCCYCLTPKGDKYHCCQENDFVTFADLYEEDQKFLIEEAIEEYEEWSKK